MKKIGETQCGQWIEQKETDSSFVSIWVSLPSDDMSLSAVLELSKESPGYIQLTFCRGGLTETQLTVREFDRAWPLVKEAKEFIAAKWPKLMRRDDQ